MLFEVCVDSIRGAVAAQRGGADRVEVCDNLVEGGTTPSIGLLKVLRQKLDIQMNAIIRPRGGDFLYSEEEFEVMAADILAAKDAGCDGVVIGLLTAEGDIDTERTGRLIAAARPMTITFHRAFDMARSPEKALQDLIGLKVDRLLTSGQKVSALEGADLIAKLVKQAQECIIIMAGAGINDQNLAQIVKKTGVKEVHFSARVEEASRMLFRNDSVFMGKEYQPQEYRLRITNEEKVRAVIHSINNQKVS